MALILRYRLDPPDSVNQEVYNALVKQIGATGLNVEVPLNEEGTASVRLAGTFVSIEGEHAESVDMARAGAHPGEEPEAKPKMSDHGDSFAGEEDSSATFRRDCPETGGPCQFNCEVGRRCWLVPRLASEPEGRDTGLHRDSMG